MELALEDEFNELNNNSSGFCWVLLQSAILIIGRKGDDSKLNIESYPELIAYKPKNLIDESLYWFDVDLEGKKKRLEIIREIIKKLENEIL